MGCRGWRSPGALRCWIRVEEAALAEQFGVAAGQVRRDHLISHLLAALSLSLADELEFLRTNILLIVGEEDSLFDIDESCNFFDAYCVGGTQRWRVRRGRHLTNHVIVPYEYADQVVRFLTAAFATPAPEEFDADC